MNHENPVAITQNRTLNPHIDLANARIVGQVIGWPARGNTAGFDNKCLVRQIESSDDILLDQQNGDIGFVYFNKSFAQPLNDLAVTAIGGLRPCCVPEAGR